jgi:hypothetical protein
MFVFLLFTLLSIPIVQIYTKADAYDIEVNIDTSYERWSIGNMGYAS